MVRCRFCLQKPSVFPCFYPGGCFCRSSSSWGNSGTSVWSSKESMSSTLVIMEFSTNDGLSISFRGLNHPNMFCQVTNSWSSSFNSWAKRPEQLNPKRGWHVVDTKAMEKWSFQHCPKVHYPFTKYIWTSNMQKKTKNPKSFATIYLFLLQHPFWAHLAPSKTLICWGNHSQDQGT